MTLDDLLIIAALAGISVCVSATAMLGWLLYRDLTWRDETVEYEVELDDEICVEGTRLMAEHLQLEARDRR